uniref:RAP domain-containing protein n=1 Tax=Chromera velia CCMP2878 TaxID=1169474 RepID=A0A0G4F1Y0_9ALVE|eukprot:Cvel_14749.t1-p1 / transcript=Cvel_14749.t1 / gene=Cvel_14749 / organism=Chromera_velia_CCMP2878 / gene_product=hypothetical protein / transcript_product=hypothetical protein / location=Cvel_scaffold1061:30848-35364(-) / protein_length=1239 / sequence_SO=supercontig / SO=protein_coding / is_pseudo=false
MVVTKLVSSDVRRPQEVLRKLCAWNSELSRCSSAETLLDLVAEREMRLNTVNRVTALFRLGKLFLQEHPDERGSESALRRWRSLSGGRERVFRSLVNDVKRLNYTVAQPKTLANAFWALTVFGVNDPVAFSRLADAVVQRRDAVKPKEMACVLWCFHRMRFYHRMLLNAACAQLADFADEFEPNNVALTVWALGKFGFFHAGAFSAVSRTVMRRTSAFSANQLGMIALSIANLGRRGDFVELFDVIAESLARQEALESLSLSQLANALDAFGQVPVAPGDVTGASYISARAAAESQREREQGEWGYSDMWVHERERETEKDRTESASVPGLFSPLSRSSSTAPASSPPPSRWNALFRAASERAQLGLHGRFGIEGGRGRVGLDEAAKLFLCLSVGRVQTSAQTGRGGRDTETTSRLAILLDEAADVLSERDRRSKERLRDCDVALPASSSVGKGEEEHEEKIEETMRAAQRILEAYGCHQHSLPPPRLLSCCIRALSVAAEVSLARTAHSSAVSASLAQRAAAALMGLNYVGVLSPSAQLPLMRLLSVHLSGLCSQPVEGGGHRGRGLGISNTDLARFTPCVAAVASLGHIDLELLEERGGEIGKEAKRRDASTMLPDEIEVVREARRLAVLCLRASVECFESIARSGGVSRLSLALTEGSLHLLSGPFWAAVVSGGVRNPEGLSVCERAEALVMTLPPDRIAGHVQAAQKITWALHGLKTVRRERVGGVAEGKRESFQRIEGEGQRQEEEEGESLSERRDLTNESEESGSTSGGWLESLSVLSRHERSMSAHDFRASTSRLHVMVAGHLRERFPTYADLYSVCPELQEQTSSAPLPSECVDWRMEEPVGGAGMLVDIAVPSLRLAVEVDGASHFLVRADAAAENKYSHDAYFGDPSLTSRNVGGPIGSGEVQSLAGVSDEMAHTETHQMMSLQHKSRSGRPGEGRPPVHTRKPFQVPSPVPTRSRKEVAVQNAPHVETACRLLTTSVRDGPGRSLLEKGPGRDTEVLEMPAEPFNAPLPPPLSPRRPISERGNLPQNPPTIPHQDTNEAQRHSHTSMCSTPLHDAHPQNPSYFRREGRAKMQGRPVLAHLPPTPSSVSPLPPAPPASSRVGTPPLPPRQSPRPSRVPQKVVEGAQKQTVNSPQTPRRIPAHGVDEAIPTPSLGGPLKQRLRLHGRSVFKHWFLQRDGWRVVSLHLPSYLLDTRADKRELDVVVEESLKASVRSWENSTESHERANPDS